MSAARREGAPPDFRDDPDRFKGLTQRRRERGLATGTIVHGPYCPHCCRAVPPTGTDCPFCHRSFR